MAREIIRLDSRRPARDIGTNRRSLTGRVAFKGSSLQFESSLERDLYQLLRFDKSVEEILPQPFTIDFVDRAGCERHYTPDALVTFTDGRQEIYEVKYRANLGEQWEVLKPRFKAAIRYAKSNGMRFKILTEREIRGPYLANLKFLAPYRERSRDPAIEEHLVSTLAALEVSTPEILLAAAYQHKENRIKAVPSLWRMIANGRIEAWLHEPLTMASEIWVVVGEGYIWQDPHSYHSLLVR